LVSSGEVPDRIPLRSVADGFLPQALGSEGDEPKIIIEPLNMSERKDWKRIIQETAGSWKDIDPNYVDELRAAFTARLDETNESSD
jgi:hypothetical protein